MVTRKIKVGLEKYIYFENQENFRRKKDRRRVRQGQGEGKRSVKEAQMMMIHGRRRGKDQWDRVWPSSCQRMTLVTHRMPYPPQDMMGTKISFEYFLIYSNE